MILGCSDSPKEPKQPSNTSEATTIRDTMLKQQRQAWTTMPHMRYMFGNSFEIEGDDPYIYGEHFIHMEGKLSSAFQTTVLNIWQGLSQKGFSGYEVDTLAGNTAYTYNYGVRVDGSIDIERYPVMSDPHVPSFVNDLIDLIIKPYEYAYGFEGLKLDCLPKTYISTLVGYQYKGRTLSKSGSGGGYELQGEAVTQEQIDEWDQVFIRELKKDSFFRNLNTSSLSSGIQTQPLRQRIHEVDLNQLRVNGSQGESISVRLPVCVQLAGEVSGDNVDIKGVSGLRIGSMHLGLTYAYANQLPGILSQRHQMETSLIVSQPIGAVFIEGQFGVMCANELSLQLMGTRQQVRVGMDIYPLSPFVGYEASNWKSVATQKTLSVGCEIDLYRHKNHNSALTLSGVIIGGTQLDSYEFKGEAKLRANLELDEGISFELRAGSKQTGFNFALEH